MTSRRARSLRAWWFAALAAVAAGACTPDLLVGGVRPDAGPLDAPDPDAGAMGPDVVPLGGPCARHAECDNGRYCDGEERCTAGACAAGATPCDDRVGCTRDTCDEATRACAPVPDNAMCGDRNACNGVERCNPGSATANPLTGCEPVIPDGSLDCDDANTCTIDTCDPAAGCLHTPRDLDGDGAVDRACTLDGTPRGTPGTDCNDNDPTVYPGAREVCNDGRDNNCDALIDAMDPTCVPANDDCATATRLTGGGMFVGSTTGLRDDIELGCNPGGEYPDAVYEFTTTSTQDITVITAVPPGANAAVALVADCGPPLDERRCVRAPFGGSPSLRARSVPAGRYRIVVETGTGTGAFRMTLRLEPPSTTPPEDTCPATGLAPAVELSDGAPHVARLSALDDDYTLACGASARPDAVFRLTLAAAADVRLTATAASGSVYLSFRDPPCATTAGERHCVSARVAPPTAEVSESRLAAGTYWLLVEHSTDQDVTVTARVMP